ncbi:uncharacterized protein B0P05DRAFT_463314 [Gilbertella persicaria]|nr:uncharacterized protein B0P05DRAFT_463314 [Gilbertella persicaria]KAI8091468.1 hypothetical protein B0P05DRAFT_463314 [Gilbertella persicaria]
MLEGIQLSKVEETKRHRRHASENALHYVPAPLEPKLDYLLSKPRPPFHSRSYSHDTHPCPTPKLAPLHRRAVSTNSLDFILQPTTEVLDSKPKKTTETKYSCSYCNKGFSRPSSLRIHTYSHTGERPFECPEVGCSRKFSVQSNMRRHLRVHRLGRPLKRNGGFLSPADRAQLINKPLAAKPTIPSTNWIGVTILPV